MLNDITAFVPLNNPAFVCTTIMISPNEKPAVLCYVNLSGIHGNTDPAWLSLTNERKFVD